MKCRGCYRETKDSFCNRCRKSLFHGRKVDHVLPFAAPKPENLKEYQEHTKSMSISGVQLKYSLKLEDDQLVITEKNGEYILKPIPPSRLITEPSSAPGNEHVTMQLAEQVFKMNTAANALMEFSDGEPAYITRRFDMQHDGLKRMQEDFAQLGQRSEGSHGKNYKYDGTYEEIGKLIRQYVAASMPELEKFFELVVFNYLLSNGDAHLKNFSLARMDYGEYVLTPAYDLMCTRIHTPSESDVALDLYKGEMNTAFYKSFGYYGKPDFLELAEKLQLVAVRAERIIDRMLSREEEAVNFIRESFLPAKTQDMYVQLLLDKFNRFRQVV